MQEAEFHKILEEQMHRCMNLLTVKAKEYATEDRLHNFKNAAVLQNVTVRQALAGIMVKHTVSIYDMCESYTQYPLDVWNEKLTDHLNYLFLLRAIVQEEAAASRNDDSREEIKYA